jgi:hypothetical protein
VSSTGCMRVRGGSPRPSVRRKSRSNATWWPTRTCPRQSARSRAGSLDRRAAGHRRVGDPVNAHLSGGIPSPRFASTSSLSAARTPVRFTQAIRRCGRPHRISPVVSTSAPCVRRSSAHPIIGRVAIHLVEEGEVVELGLCSGPDLRRPRGDRPAGRTPPPTEPPSGLDRRTIASPANRPRSPGVGRPPRQESPSRCKGDAIDARAIQKSWAARSTGVASAWTRVTPQEILAQERVDAVGQARLPGRDHEDPSPRASRTWASRSLRLRPGSGAGRRATVWRAVARQSARWLISSASAAAHRSDLRRCGIHRGVSPSPVASGGWRASRADGAPDHGQISHHRGQPHRR